MLKNFVADRCKPANIHAVNDEGLYFEEYRAELWDARGEYCLKISEEEVTRLFLYGIPLADCAQAVRTLRNELARERHGERMLRHAGHLLDGVEFPYASEQDPVKRGCDLIHFAVSSGRAVKHDIKRWLTPGQQARLQARIEAEGFGDADKGRKVWCEFTR